VLIQHDSRFLNSYRDSNWVDATLNMTCVGTIYGIGVRKYVNAFGFAQSIVSTSIVVIYLCTYGPLIMLAGWKNHAKKQRNTINTNDKEKEVTTLSRLSKTSLIWGVQFNDVQISNILYSFSFLLRNPVYLYYCLYLFMAIVGTSVHNFFFAFHLFDILLR